MGTLLNHMLRYHLRRLLVPIWKKPKVNLPLLETSLASVVNGRPPESVSVAMEYEGVCCCEKRSQQRTTRRRGRMATGMKERCATGEVASYLAAAMPRPQEAERVLSLA